MTLTILMLLSGLVEAAPAVEEGPQHAAATTPVCGLVLESDPYERGPNHSRVIEVGIDNPAISPDPIVVAVHITGSNTDRAPVWGDVVAVQSAAVDDAQGWDDAHDGMPERTRGSLTTASGRCATTGGTVVPWAVLEVGASVQEVWK